MLLDRGVPITFGRSFELDARQPGRAREQRLSRNARARRNHSAEIFPFCRDGVKSCSRSEVHDDESDAIFS